MKIAMLGAGAYGTALGGVLAENGHTVEYYDPYLNNNKLADVLQGVTAIVSTVPSKALPELIQNLPKDIFFIVATKGFLTDQIFAQFNDWAVLSGPGFADDIKTKKETFLTATDKRIIKMFSTSYLHFDYTLDRLGVLMCGSLKNIYALLAGFKGIMPEAKNRQEYLNEAKNEMRAILAVNQANPGTVDLHCGIGDLDLTCTPSSRNFSFGHEIQRNSNFQPNYTVEGLSALNRIRSGEVIIPDNTKLLHELLEVSKKWN